MAEEGTGDTLLSGHQEDCNDWGTCWSGVSVDDVSRIIPATERLFLYIQPYYTNGIQAERFMSHSVLFVVQNITSSFPSIFLQNCSFLI